MIRKYKRGYIIGSLSGLDSSLYSADEVIGKTLYAKRGVTVYDSSLKTVLYRVNAGQRVGVVYSYILSNGKVIWILEPQNYVSIAKGYIPHETGAFDIDILREQGVKTTQELQEEKAAREKEELTPWYQTFFSSAGSTLGSTLKTVKTIAIVGLAAWVGVKVYNAYQNGKKNNGKN
jgi:hypothetical protein